MIRTPIVCVLGHVDHGKTKILDSIRGTAVQLKEAGNITQHIGATEVPVHVIEKLSGQLLKKFGFALTVPGLLFIDTPGHEAFTNLRRRGGSIADLAVLVIDLSQGIQPQTREAIEILRAYKTPFVVAANKLDALHSWNSRAGSFLNNLPNQSAEAAQLLDEKIYSLVGGLHELGFQSERFDRCTDFTKQIPLVPTSATEGEGIPELLMLLSGLSQKFLSKRLDIPKNAPARGTTLEVRKETGLGMTVDIILYEGVLKIGDEVALGGREGLLTSKVRALLQPAPLEEMRLSKKKFRNIKQAVAATGVKVAAPGIEHALPGSPFMQDSAEARKTITEELKSVTVEGDWGAIVKTDTLGSLEAMVHMLKEHKVPLKRAEIGRVTKRDVLEAFSMRPNHPYNAVVFAFHAQIEPLAVKEAEKAGIKVFKGNVIYKLLEDHALWAQEQKERKKAEKLRFLVRPASFQILPDHVFRRNTPAIVGVRVLTGVLQAGASVMKKTGEQMGRAERIQAEGKDIQEARQGSEVAVSITQGNVGRNLHEKDTLYTVVKPEQADDLRKYLELSVEEESLLEKILSHTQ